MGMEQTENLGGGGARAPGAPPRFLRLCNSSDVASIAVHTHMTWQVPTSGYLHLGENKQSF